MQTREVSKLGSTRLNSSIMPASEFQLQSLHILEGSCLRLAFSIVFVVEYEYEGFVWTCKKPLI